MNEEITGIKSVSERRPEFHKTLGDNLKIKTGFIRLDKALQGFYGVVLLEGNDTRMKTVLASQIALNTVSRWVGDVFTQKEKKKQIPVLFYALESSPRDFFIHTTAWRAEVDIPTTEDFIDNSEQYTRIGATLPPALAGLDNRYKFKDLKKAKNDIECMDNLYVFDSLKELVTTESIEKDIKEAKAKHNGENVLVVIDTVQPLGEDSYTQIQQLNQIRMRTGATILVTSDGVNPELHHTPEIVMLLETTHSVKDKYIENARLTVTKNRHSNTARKANFDMDKNFLVIRDTFPETKKLPHAKEAECTQCSKVIL